MVDYVGFHFLQPNLQTGSHHIYSREGVDAIISVPVHSNRDLPIGTLKSIMKDAQLEEEDLN